VKNFHQVLRSNGSDKNQAAIPRTGLAAEFCSNFDMPAVRQRLLSDDGMGRGAGKLTGKFHLPTLCERLKRASSALLQVFFRQLQKSSLDVYFCGDDRGLTVSVDVIPFCPLRAPRAA
jgi:hypothetical protein